MLLLDANVSVNNDLISRKDPLTKLTILDQT